MSSMVELTDLMTDDPAAVVVPVTEVAATVRRWYPADEHVRPSELDAIDELQAALVAEDYAEARDIAAELAVGFDMVQVDH